ncbi:Nucleosomal histone H3-Lys79 methylase [Entophlyctis sp. JEL0112]|nr:Nucleosomal histone H3-Lys79 methylase [Entophlyctis sp. JEL0112]
MEGILRSVIRACNRKNPEALKTAVENFNWQLNNVRKARNLKQRVGNAHEKQLITTPHPNLIYHILDQAYAHTVAPRVDILKSYKVFSNNVYGEVNHTLVTELINRTHLARQHVFLDMGSGTGNVVLQVAAQAQCTAYGIEIMPNPNELGQAQRSDFLARCALYNVHISATRVELWHGDFLDDPRVLPVLSRADVVFVNNYAFDAKLNFRILERFLDLKDGAIVVSLKLFGTSTGENSLETMFRVREYYFGANQVSWMAEGGKYYIHTLRR